jgi:hypothetical protein
VNQQESTLRQTAWLFTRQDKSVRLEVQTGPDGAVLLVSGPDQNGARHDFADVASLEIFREGFERDLVARGFRLQAVAERRSEGDRRQASRPGSSDRRRR